MESGLSSTSASLGTSHLAPWACDSVGGVSWSCFLLNCSVFVLLPIPVFKLRELSTLLTIKDRSNESIEYLSLLLVLGSNVPRCIQ